VRRYETSIPGFRHLAAWIDKIRRLIWTKSSDELEFDSAELNDVIRFDVDRSIDGAAIHKRAVGAVEIGNVPGKVAGLEASVDRREEGLFRFDRKARARLQNRLRRVDHNELRSIRPSFRRLLRRLSKITHRDAEDLPEKEIEESSERESKPKEEPVVRNRDFQRQHLLRWRRPLAPVLLEWQDFGCERSERNLVARSHRLRSNAFSIDTGAVRRIEIDNPNEIVSEF
jgi:hypothetical protein